MGSTRAAVDLLPQDVNSGRRLESLARLVSATPELREAYSSLLSAIRLSAPFVSGRSLLITSTQPNEGKTTVAACLAIAASLAGQTVLLVDGDLRRPSLALAAGITNGVGFSDVLDGAADATDTIHRVALFEDTRDVCSVNIMSAGGKSPEFLARVDWAKARSTLQSISEQYGLVLFDSPPVLAANDALLLAGIVDGILLVVGAGSADRNEVRRAKEQLEPIGTPLIGAVLNQFDPKLHGRVNKPYLGYNLDVRR